MLNLKFVQEDYFSRKGLKVFILFLFLFFSFISYAQDTPEIIPQIGHLHNISALDFSPNMESLASISEHSLKIWDIPTGLLKKSIPFQGKYYALKYDTDSTILILSTDGNLLKYDQILDSILFTVNLKLDNTFYDVHDCYLMTIVPEKEIVFTISEDFANQVVIHKRSSLNGELIEIIHDKLDGVVGLKVYKDKLYYSDYGGTLYEYDIMTNERKELFKINNSLPVQLGVSEGNVAVFQNNKNLVFYDLKGNITQQVQVVFEEDYFYRRDHPMSFSEHGFYFNMVGKEVDTTLSVELQRPMTTSRIVGSNYKGEVVNLKLEDYSSIDNMSLSDDGSLLAVSNDTDIHLIDTKVKRVVKEFKNTIQQIKQIEFISDNKILVNPFVSESNVEIWDLATGQIKGFPQLTSESEHIDYNHATNQFAVSYGLEVHFYDGDFNKQNEMFITTDIQRLSSVSGGYMIPAGYYPVRFGHDGKTLLTQDGKECGIKLWSLPEQKLLSKKVVEQEGHIVEHIDYNSALSLAIIETSNNYMDDYKSRIIDLKSGKIIYEGEFNYSFKARFIPNTQLAIVPDGIIDLQTKKITDVFDDETPWRSGSIYVDNKNELYFLTDNSLQKYNVTLEKFENVIETGGEGFAVRNNIAAVFEREGKVKLYNLEKDSLMATIFSENVKGTKSFLIYTDDNYYMNNQYGLNTIGYHWRGNLYRFDQFDLLYNRPDIVLNRIGFASEDIINTYSTAYKKRFQNENPPSLSDFEKLKVSILNRDNINVVPESSEVNLRMNAKSSDNPVVQYQIRNNGVLVVEEVFENPANSVTWESTIRLMPGQNLLEITVVDNNDIHSLSTSVKINLDKEETLPNLYYVGIGVQEYANTSMNLSYPVKDIEDLSYYFKKSTYFKSIETLLLKNSSFHNNSISEIEEFISKAQETDIIIVSYSGHGLLDDAGDFYLSTYLSDYDNAGQEGVSIEAIEQVLTKSRSLKRIFFVDACHSGLLDRDDFKITNNSPQDTNVFAQSKGTGVVTTKKPQQDAFELMQTQFMNLDRGSGTHVIAAAGGDQFAFENSKLQNGLFTYALLEVLKKGEGDSNNDEFISVNELRDQLEATVLKLSGGKQKPASRKLNYHFDFSLWNENDTEFNFFHSAVKQNNWNAVRYWLDKGFDVNTKDPENSFTALHYAAREGHFHMVDYLINKGADIDAQTSFLWSPLHLAAVNNHALVYQLLKHKGANNQLKDINENTPLEAASEKHNYEIISLEKDPQLNSLQFAFCYAIRNHDVKTFDELIEKVNISSTEPGGTLKPIHLASIVNASEFVLQLLEKGESAEELDASGKYPPMYFALSNNAYTSAIILYKHGAQIEIEHYRNLGGFYTYSLSDKIKTFIADPDGILLKYDQVDAIIDALEDKNISKIDSLLNVYGIAHKDFRTMESGYNLVTMSIVCDSNEMLEYFLQKEIDINQPADNHVTPLFLAIYKNRASAVELLVQNGAFTGYNDYFKATPLDLARSLENKEVIEILQNIKGTSK